MSLKEIANNKQALFHIAILIGAFAVITWLAQPSSNGGRMVVKQDSDEAHALAALKPLASFRRPNNIHRDIGLPSLLSLHMFESMTGFDRVQLVKNLGRLPTALWVVGDSLSRAPTWFC